MIQFDGTKTLALYNFKTDKMLTQDVKDTQPEIKSRMEEKIKAIVQQYNNRLVEDRFTVKEKVTQ
jgi:hypothetical protein